MNQAPKSDMSTKHRLIEAAWTVVREEGLAAATSRRITTVAGANLGAITYHFGSKNALIAEAAVSRLRVWTQPLADALLADETDHGSRTDNFIASLFDVMDDTTNEAQPLLEVLLAGHALPDARQVARDEITHLQTVVADLVIRMQQRDEVPADVAPAAMAGLFTAFALGMMLQSTIGAMPATAPEITGQLLALLKTSK